MKHTVLEIGSGSYKLHKENEFSERFESSLGKNMQGAKLAASSVQTALENLKQKIIPFLKTKNIALGCVIVFATAAVRKAMQDRGQSGQQFLDQLISLGFKDPRVFSEDDECRYAAYGVIQEMREKYPNTKNYCMLDTGGGSHQLVSIDDKGQKIPEAIVKMQSIPLGSHSDLSNLATEANFIEFGFKPYKNLVLIGTTASILSSMHELSQKQLARLVVELEKMNLEQRREHLTKVIKAAGKSPVETKKLLSLLVDYRLQILPNAFKLILNCARNLGVEKFISCSRQAMNYISCEGL